MAEVAGGGETARANPGEFHPGVGAPGYEWYSFASSASLFVILTNEEFVFVQNATADLLMRTDAEVVSTEVVVELAATIDPRLDADSQLLAEIESSATLLPRLDTSTPAIVYVFARALSLPLNLATEIVENISAVSQSAEISLKLSPGVVTISSGGYSWEIPRLGGWTVGADVDSDWTEVSGVTNEWEDVG